MYIIKQTFELQTNIILSLILMASIEPDFFIKNIMIECAKDVQKLRDNYTII